MSYSSSHASSSDFGPAFRIETHELVHQFIQHFCIAVIVANEREKRTAQQFFNDWSPSVIPQFDIRSYLKTWLVFRTITNK